MRVDLITHGGPGIGLGHLMRTVALAEALSEINVGTRFLLPDRHGAEYLSSQGFENLILGYHLWRQPPKNSADLFVVDHYRVDVQYFKLFEAQAPVLYIDDLCSEPYPISYVLNGHFYGLDLPYARMFPGAVRLLGPEYFLLRRVYRDRVACAEERCGILVTTGGTDPQNHMPELIREVLAGIGDTPIEVHVVVGSGFSYARTILECAKTDPRIIVHENPEHLAGIMSRCKVAVSAAGTTLYELAALGIPALTWPMVDNQRYVFQSTCSQALAVPFDPYAEGELASKLRGLLRDPDEIKRMGARLRFLVDGLGACRTAQVIADKMKSR